MQTRSKILDDVAQLFTNALGVAQGARSEAETAMRGFMDRWIAERGLVTQEEFEALREMALRLRAENEALAARLARVEETLATAQPSRVSGEPGAADPPAPRRARKQAAAPRARGSAKTKG
jgi:BMFP domain-containing protein YqiC